MCDFYCLYVKKIIESSKIINHLFAFPEFFIRIFLFLFYSQIVFYLQATLFSTMKNVSLSRNALKVMKKYAYYIYVF